jgi:hypothetical protein
LPGELFFVASATPQQSKNVIRLLGWRL